MAKNSKSNKLLNFQNINYLIKKNTTFENQYQYYGET